MKKHRNAIILFIVALLLCGHSSVGSDLALPTEPEESTEEVYRTYHLDGLNYRETRIIIGEQEYFGLELLSCSRIINEGAFEIPDEVKGIPVIAIGDQVFQGRTILTKVVLPSNLVAIGELAFSGCTNLTELTLPDTVRRIGFRAFENCPGLKELRVTPDMELEFQALYSATGLESVYMEDGVNHIMVEFWFNSSVTYVRFPQDATMLGIDPITGLSGGSILSSTDVRFFEVHEGVIALGSCVFAHTELESIVLPSTLETVGKEIFFSSDRLEAVFFRGTEEQCLQELKDQVADVGATIYYLSETEPTEEGNFWHYVDGKPVIW